MSEPSEPSHDAEGSQAPGTDQTQSPGQYLRQVRLRRGLDLAQVARELRLTPERVKAIENEDHLRLPDAVFVVGYVKNYARLLDLDPEAMGEAYRAVLPPLPARQPGGTPAARQHGGTPSPSARQPGGTPSARQPGGTPAAPERQATRNPKRPSKAQIHESHWAAITALLLVIILALAWWLQRPADQTVARTQAREQPVPDVLVQPQTATDEEPEEDLNADTSLGEPSPESLDEPLDDPEAIEEEGGGESDAAAKTPKGANVAATTERQSLTPPEADVARAVEKLEVVISFSGPTSVDIRDSTMNYGLIGEMDKGDQHLLGGQPPYSIILGNAAATKITVGGQPFDFRSVVHGNVARFILDPAPKPKTRP